MLLLPLLFAATAIDPMAVVVINAIGKHDCPALFGMLSPSFQQQVPAPQWPKFCDGIGDAATIERVADKDGWPTYHLTTTTGEWELGLVLEGKLGSAVVTGLRAQPYIAASTAKTLSEELAFVGVRHKVPGMAALSMQGGKTTAQATWGVRKSGDATPVGPNDRWHLGSDTKAMTATLAALLVDAGKLQWTSTVRELMPEWTDLDPVLAGATVEQLLSHRAGLPSEIPTPIWAAMWSPANPATARTEAAHALLRLTPTRAGSYAYANASYIVVGVLLEKVGKDTWEHLLQRRVFAPLQMTSCGFGVPAGKDQVDQPWGHRVEADGRVVAVDTDNPASLGPAGTVHCALADWARFVDAHLRAPTTGPLALQAATWTKLHTPVAGGDYALGWIVTHDKWTSAPVLTHDGSNTVFTASVVAAGDEAFFAVANRGDDAGSAAVHEVIGWMITAR